jgi:hypothetical protein
MHKFPTLHPTTFDRVISGTSSWFGRLGTTKVKKRKPEL